MSKSSELFLQLTPRPAGTRNNTLIITSPYTHGGYQPPEVKQGAATFVVDPTSGTPQGGSNTTHVPGILVRAGHQPRDVMQRDATSGAHAQFEARDQSRQASVCAGFKPEVSSLDITLGPRGSNLVNIQPEGGGNGGGGGEKAEGVPKLATKENRINISVSNTESSLLKLHNGKLVSLDAEPPQVLVTGVSQALVITGQASHGGVHVRTLVAAPGGGATTNRPPALSGVASTNGPSSPVSFHASDVRDPCTHALTPPAAFLDAAPLVVMPTSPRATLQTAGSGSSHHFRFSPSLARRPSRLQTVPELTPPGEFSPPITPPCVQRVHHVWERVGVVRREVGGEEEYGGGEGPLRNGNSSELFTTVVNFQLDRDSRNATQSRDQYQTPSSRCQPLSRQVAWESYTPDVDGDIQEDTGGLRIAASHIRNVKSPECVSVSVPTGRSQETGVLQTELRLQGAVREELPPSGVPTFCLQHPASVVNGRWESYSQEGAQAARHSERPEPETSPVNDEAGDCGTLKLPAAVADVDSGSEPEAEAVAYDPRRRTSYRISTISEDGIRAWTQNARSRLAAGSGSGSGDLYGGPPGVGDDDVPYMEKLKNVASRLKLATRRPSVQAWRERVVGKPPASWRNGTSGANRKKSSLRDFGDVEDESDASQWSDDRRDRVGEALSWLRRELLYMREQDQSLARYLITLRHDIQQVKLARSSAEHQEAIDDAADELEEARHLAGHSDTPPEYFSTPLKQFGVTRMNINSRRFSVF